MIPGKGTFSLQDIVGAMQHGASLQMVQNYLGYYGQKTVKRNINGMMASQQFFSWLQCREGPGKMTI
jgi:hypothetical protein